MYRLHSYRNSPPLAVDRVDGECINGGDAQLCPGLGLPCGGAAGRTETGVHTPEWMAILDKLDKIPFCVTSEIDTPSWIPPPVDELVPAKPWTALLIGTRAGDVVQAVFPCVHVMTCSCYMHHPASASIQPVTSANQKKKRRWLVLAYACTDTVCNLVRPSITCHERDGRGALCYLRSGRRGGERGH